MKRKKIAILFGTVLSSSLALTTILITKDNISKAKVTDEISAALSFNAENCSIIPHDEYFDYITEGTLSGGDKVYAMVFDTNINYGEDSIGAFNNDHHMRFASTVDGLAPNFKFQEVSQIDFAFSNGCNGEFYVRHGFDDSSLVDTILTIDEGVVNSFVPTEGDRVFELYAPYYVDIRLITFHYNCSYDYVEPESPNKTIDILATNDFHGYVKPDGTHIGLEKYGTFMKEFSSEPNTLVLDQGDSWQGTAYSNLNYGHLVNDVMAYAGVSARTIGNHDFDWGTSHLVENTAREFKYEDSDTHQEVTVKVPTLAANVFEYDFENKQYTNNHCDEFGDEYICYTLENGLKVGIVGVIGAKQFTSINSIYTQDIYFKDHIQTIKDVSTVLRNDENCDVVICTIHAGQEDVLGNGLENYVDLVLCAHTHVYEHTQENGLHYYQFGSEGMTAGYVSLNYNTLTHNVTATGLLLNKAMFDSSISDSDLDPIIHDLVQDEYDRCDPITSEVLATGVVGSFGTGGVSEGPALVARAIYDYVTTQTSDTDILFSYCNNTRAVLNSGTWTFEDLYSALPFDNEIYIVEITGEDIFDEVRGYNSIYASDTWDRNIDFNATYKVAILDYLLFHNNVNKQYDYFPHADFEHARAVTKTVNLEEVPINYREITRWWLKEYMHLDEEANSINSYDFTTNNNPRHNKTFNYPTRTITFSENYEGGNDNFYQTTLMCGQRYNYAYPSENPVRSGYSFLGWYLDSAGTQTSNSRYLGKYNVTLYAKWGELTTVTYDFNDGRGTYDTNPNAIVGRYNVNFYPSEPTRDGYMFEGWYLEPECKNRADYVNVTGAITLYANWIQITSLICYYNYDEMAGVAFYAYGDCQVGETIESQMPPSNPERAGYAFTGWYYEPECINPVNLSAVFTAETVTLYAGWTVADAIYESDEMWYQENTYFAIGSTQTTFNATNGSENATVTCNHSPLLDASQYNEFDVPILGYIEVCAPENFVVSEIKIQTYSSYDNFNFYESGQYNTSTHAPIDEDPVALVESRNPTTVGISSVLIYNVAANSNKVLIYNTNPGYRVSVYYLKVTLTKIS